jgi:hypothetical protein
MEALAAEVGRRLSPARGRPVGEAEQLRIPHQEQIRPCLRPGPGQKRGLRLTKVHRVLERQGVQVPYSSLHRFAAKHCGLAERHVTVRMDGGERGEAAEVDFGRLGLVRDPVTARRRMLWALVVILIYSLHRYVHTTFSQQIGEVIGGLEDAWDFFEGVTRRLIVNNLAAALTRPDRYDRIFQRIFNEYARCRGFVIDPALCANPRESRTSSGSARPQWAPGRYGRSQLPQPLAARSAPRTTPQKGRR